MRVYAALTGDSAHVKGTRAVGRERDLVAPGIERPGGIWADIGSGVGYFTLALCQIVGSTAEIYSVDKNARALEKQRRGLGKLVPDARIHYVLADFTQSLDLPQLDGMVMANALHDVKLERQEATLRHLYGYLKPAVGRLIFVEHEARAGSPWVPYPVNYESFEYLAGQAGFVDVRRIAVLPAGMLREMYSALAMRGG